MELLTIIWLGLLQGITVFLPVSSTGHLVIVHSYLQVPLSNTELLGLETIYRLGNVLALVITLWPVWKKITTTKGIFGYKNEPPLSTLIAIGTLPLLIAGTLTAGWLQYISRTPLVSGIGFLTTAVLLMIVSFRYNEKTARKQRSTKDLWLMGVMQTAALVPGFSHIGWLYAGGILAKLHINRVVPMLLLLSAPSLLLGTLATSTLNGPSIAQLGIPTLATAFTTSFLASLVAIYFLQWWIKRFGVWAFSVYLFMLSFFVLGIEFQPIILAAQSQLAQLHPALILTILFFSLLLEGIPLTSTVAPGTIMMLAAGSTFADNPLMLLQCIIVSILGTVAGHSVGYFPALRTSKSFKEKLDKDARIRKAMHLFRKWGFWAVLIGGWYAALRSFISIAAGLSHMPIRRYLLAIGIGSTLWVTFFTLGPAFLFELMG